MTVLCVALTVVMFLQQKHVCYLSMKEIFKSKLVQDNGE